ncbi:ubiquitin-like domain-containing protein [Cohnella rhizosphaerae]|uniref:Ubiquitin-like domain-containing protein n=1 Tax=Cohnella rhizosphaerae TaxID=1457232 RepID=A0A9X4QS30_9BACL|nr:ubiquitin-like domain-containing protein [Cohnella rhizosphaerae]MDG0808903.1 ubiquitin-like domain-containing protein [Cohnella rhizosphaerae]
MSFALTICLIMLLHGASAKSVTVVDGGKSTVIQTRTSDVSALFKEAGITVGPNDRLSASLTSSVEDGTRVVIDRAMSVQLVADGKKETKYTTVRTVGDLLRDEGIALSAEDKVTPALTAKIDEGLQVKVVRVKREVVTTEHPMAYKVIKTADQSLLVGKTKVVQTGKQGLLVKKVRTRLRRRQARRRATDLQIARSADRAASRSRRREEKGGRRIACFQQIG